MTTHEATPAPGKGGARGQGDTLNGEHPKYSTDRPESPQLDDLARAARADWIATAARLGGTQNPEARHEVRALRLWAAELSRAAAAAGRDGAA